MSARLTGEVRSVGAIVMLFGAIGEKLFHRTVADVE